MQLRRRNIPVVVDDMKVKMSENYKDKRLRSMVNSEMEPTTPSTPQAKLGLFTFAGAVIVFLSDCM